MNPITMTASVAALIPHYRCEQWLAGCLESLLEQSRPPQAIIVLDDASEQPPVDIVARYPGVTLYRAERNVGPYRLVQQAIDDFAFDAYLFQDADDWSSPLRLERLLTAAEAAGAHLIGSYEVRVLVDEGDVEHVRYPVDVNASLRRHPQGFPLLHPTSLIARSLLERLGGFASGMRFSGDAELLRRAGHVARIVNVPEYLYFRRKRSGALTTSVETGLGAPARESVQKQLRERALRNAERVAAGEEPDLAPMSVAPSVTLEHRAGPEPVAAQPEIHRSEPELIDDERPPVFIVGPPRSGVALLAWCLAQTGDVHPLFDGRWIGTMMREVLDGVEQLFEPAGPELDAVRDAALLDAGEAAMRVLREHGDRAPQATGTAPRFVVADPMLALDLPALDRAFPGCRIVAIERPLADVIEGFSRTRAGDGEHRSRRSIDDLWRRITRSMRESAAALGADRVRTVEYRTLLAEPERTLRELSGELGIESDARALRPLAGMLPPPVTAAIEPATIGDSVSRDDATTADTSLPADVSEWWRRFIDRSVASEGERAPLAARLRAAVQRLVPEQSSIAVVSRGDDALVDFDGRRGMHFPSEADGTYIGYHPAADGDAIEHLERAIARGATHLLIPSPSLWWLEHYPELARLLADQARLVLLDPDLAALYSLDGIERAPSADSEHRDVDEDPTEELDRLRAVDDRTCRAIALALGESDDGSLTDDEHAWIDRIEAMRDRLNASQEPISIALPSKRRVEKVDTIGAICRLRSKQSLWGTVLLKLVRHLRPSQLIELGTCMGVSTSYQAAAMAINGAGSMTTLEGAPALAALSERNLASIGARGVRVVQGLFVETLPGVLESMPHIDFAFIDGHHDEHATLRYFEAMLPKAAPDAVFVFDDIRWSDGMRRAWDALRAHAAVTTSVDLGVIGVCVVNGTARHGHFAPGAPRGRTATHRPSVALAAALLPGDARVLVISRGDDALLELGSARGVHFPHDDAGAWIGYHPGDGAEALALLERAIDDGATHLLVPEDSLWWLEFYDALARSLDERHHLVIRTDDLVLYRLTPPPVAHSLHAALDQEKE